VKEETRLRFKAAFAQADELHRSVRVLYARVKATMTLRTSGDPSSGTERPLRHLRLPTALAVAVVFLLTMLAGSTGAGIANYQGTLYFAGASSSITGSYQLTTAVPSGQGLQPVATAGVPNSGGIPTGAYKYVYVTTSGVTRTASVASAPQINVTNAPVTVTNVPVGADVYRAKIPASTATAQYILVGNNAGPTTTYTDVSTATMGTLLPQADNRVALNTIGWAPFVPTVSLSGSLANTMVSGVTPPIPATCISWTVDATGGVTLPAGQWKYDVQLRSDSAGGAPAAVLTVAMWKIDTSGNAIAGGTIVPATDGGAIALDGSSQNVSVSYTTASPTTLASNERLCVQFWRHQTGAYTSPNGAANRTVGMLAWDPNTKISLHPAPNAFASAALSSPIDGSHTTSVPSLSATYSDTEADAGTLTIRLCTDFSCTASAQDSGAMAATDGATLSWTPTGLGDGTYYWDAQAQDALGLPSAWTATRSFVVDNVAPTTSITSQPPAQSNSPSGPFAFSANESVTGYQCRVDGGVFGGCASPYSYGPLADGAHSFDVKATADLAGNPGTPTNYGWTIDTVPSDTSITSQPAPLSNSASPSFNLSATEPGSTFECALDGGFAACSTPKSYSGVADGVHTFQARAVDPAANVDPSPASYTWTIDATPPDTTIGPSYPPPLTIATGATFDFSSSESPATYACALDAGAYSSCSSPKTYSGLADGLHTFHVRATDAATNTDPSPATYNWTIDTTPPSTTIGPTMPAANTQSSSATFDVGSNEPGSTFECRLDGALFASCTTPVVYGGLGDGAHTFDVRATDPAGNLDTSPATYGWKIDNVAPSTPTLTAPTDALMTNALPQLRATFDDATPGGDTGTVEFQLCSSAAPAGVSCAPVVQSVTSGSVSSGGTASATPAALADGTYHWQARAHDVAGNQSGWSATRSFQLDTSVPTVPVLATPADGAWVPTIQLSAPFSKPAFAGTGSVEFRVCSDALCLGIVLTGNSGTLINGALATWSPSSLPVDGLYYWQARSRDSSGNVSAWTASRTLHLDRVAPGKPVNFNGQVAFDGLTLRWSAPDDNVANYVVFVDGSAWKNLGSTEFEVKMGAFDSGDTRSFSVVAVDLAGNVGTMSSVLVGVPNLVGLTWPQALGATTARGLGLKRNAVFFAAIPMVVAKQEPPAPALTERGTPVVVTMSPASGAPLAVKVKPGRFVCAAGSVLRLRIDLSGAARVRSRLLNGRGRIVKRGQLGKLRAGTNMVRIKLPAGLRRGAYRLLLDATGEAGTVHALVRVTVGSRACRAH
jgi:hypothetical protein